MNKSILSSILLLTSTVLFAQEGGDDNREGITISVNANASEPAMFGVSMEWERSKMKYGRNSSFLLNISATGLQYDNGVVDVTGNGFAFEIGSRNYFKKGSYAGFYTQSFLTYSSTSFNERTSTGDFNGKYSYWSLINGDLGYKINIGKHFSIDPSVGFNWKWEVKGKGDVDNKQFDNFVFRAGVKAGYRF